MSDVEDDYDDVYDEDFEGSDDGYDEEVVETHDTQYREQRTTSNANRPPSASGKGRPAAQDSSTSDFESSSEDDSSEDKPGASPYSSQKSTPRAAPKPVVAKKASKTPGKPTVKPAVKPILTPQKTASPPSKMKAPSETSSDAGSSTRTTPRDAPAAKPSLATQKAASPSKMKPPSETSSDAGSSTRTTPRDAPAAKASLTTQKAASPPSKMKVPSETSSSDAGSSTRTTPRDAPEEKRVDNSELYAKEREDVETAETNARVVTTRQVAVDSEDLGHEEKDQRHELERDEAETQEKDAREKIQGTEVDESPKKDTEVKQRRQVEKEIHQRQENEAEERRRNAAAEDEEARQKAEKDAEVQKQQDSAKEEERKKQEQQLAKKKAQDEQFKRELDDLEGEELARRSGDSKGLLTVEKNAWEKLVAGFEKQRSAITQRAEENSKRQAKEKEAAEKKRKQQLEADAKKRQQQLEADAKKQKEANAKALRQAEKDEKEGRDKIEKGDAKSWKLLLDDEKSSRKKILKKEDDAAKKEKQQQSTPRKKAAAEPTPPKKGRQQPVGLEEEEVAETKTEKRTEKESSENKKAPSKKKERPVTAGSSTSDGSKRKKTEDEHDEDKDDADGGAGGLPRSVRCLELDSKALVKSGSKGNTMIAREKHCLVPLEGGSCVLAMGGSVGGKPESSMMLFRAGSNYWRLLRTMGCAVPPVTGHTCTFLEDRNVLVLIGGTKIPSGGGTTQKQDRFGPTASPRATTPQDAGVYTLEMTTMKWSLETASQHIDNEDAAAAGGEVPPNPNLSKHHTAVCYLGSIYVYGGYKLGGGKGGSLDVLDTTSMRWTQLSDVDFGPNRPPALSGHSATVFNHQMYIFGGKNGLDAPSDELWIFNFELFSWTRVLAAPEGKEEETAAPSPCARTNHASMLHGHYWIIHGGTAGEGVYLNDMWVLDLLTNVWAEIHLPKSAPARQFHAMAMLPHSAMAKEGEDEKGDDVQKKGAKGQKKDDVADDEDEEKEDDKPAPVIMLYGGGGIIKKSEYSQVAYTPCNSVYFIPLKEATKKDQENKDGGEEGEDDAQEDDAGGEADGKQKRQRPATAPSHRQKQRGADDDENDEEAEEDAARDRELIQRSRRFKQWNLTHTFTLLGPRTAVGRGELAPLTAEKERNLADRLSISQRDKQVEALQLKLDAQRKKDHEADRKRNRSPHRQLHDEDGKDKKPVNFHDIAQRLHDADQEYRKKRHEALLKKHLAPVQSESPGGGKLPHRVKTTGEAETYQQEMYARQVKSKQDAWTKVNRKYVTSELPNGKKTTNIQECNERLYGSRKNLHLDTIARLRRKYCPPAEKHVLNKARFQEMVERLVPDKVSRPSSPGPK